MWRARVSIFPPIWALNKIINVKHNWTFTFTSEALSRIKFIILGSESFTRWLVWGTSASTRDSARELEKIAKFFMSPLPESVESSFFLPASRVWVFQPPMIVHTTQDALIFGQKAKSNH